MPPAPFCPFLHEQMARLSLPLTLVSCCPMICDQPSWLSKNTLDTMPGFLRPSIRLVASRGRKSHTNIASVFLGCAVHYFQVSWIQKWSINILFQSSWKYNINTYNISTCDVHHSGGEPQFLLWRVTFFIPPLKGKIFYIFISNSRRLYSDSGLLLHDNLSNTNMV